MNDPPTDHSLIIPMGKRIDGTSDTAIAAAITMLIRSAVPQAIIHAPSTIRTSNADTNAVGTTARAGTNRTRKFPLIAESSV
jgi:hypothetical protein